MPEPIPFIPGLYSEESFPLGRFLPPIPFGVVSSWLKENIAPGAWIIDPFCAAPALTAEAAQAGYRVLVAANNPIERFLLELYCQPPSGEDLRAALADLSAMYKGEERIEPYLRSLYSTSCPTCNTMIEARAYTWERQTMKPIRKEIRCQICGSEENFPSTQADQDRAARHSTKGLHWFRALERVAPLNDPDRQHAQDALAAYLPRSVDALFNLINRLDHFPADKRRLIEALLIPVFDLCTTLWPIPVTQNRPRQISIPAHFRELNVWSAMEEAIQIWSNVSKLHAYTQPSIQVSHFPEVLKDPGITIFEGRLKDLSSILQSANSQELREAMNFKAVLMPLPRLNQAYWTLSTLWAGWLWGSEQTETFKSVLRRKRYDWGWHSTALSTAFRSLVSLLDDTTPCIGLIGENEPGFIASSLLAGAQSHLSLQGIALQQDKHQAQIHWVVDQHKKNRQDYLPSQFQEMIARKGNRILHKHLYERGEPASYALLHAVMISEIVTSSDFGMPAETNSSDILSMTQTTLQHATTQDPSLTHVGGSERSVESGTWYFLFDENEPFFYSELSHTLVDRVEMELVRILKENPNLNRLQIEKNLYQKFPGFFTPDSNLVEVLLASYGESTPGAGWQLKKQDQPEQRQIDIQNLEQVLERTSQLIGFQIYRSQLLGIEDQQAILLNKGSASPEYLFLITATAILGPILAQVENSIRSQNQDKPRKKILVIPGSRSNLIHYKLEHNLVLKNAIQAEWRFLKFRSLRRLESTDQLNASNLDFYISQDPLEKTDPQLSLW